MTLFASTTFVSLIDIVRCPHPSPVQYDHRQGQAIILYLPGNLAVGGPVYESGLYKELCTASICEVHSWTGRGYVVTWHLILKEFCRTAMYGTVTYLGCSTISTCCVRVA